MKAVKNLCQNSMCRVVFILYEFDFIVNLFVVFLFVVVFGSFFGGEKCYCKLGISNYNCSLSPHAYVQIFLL